MFATCKEKRGGSIALSTRGQTDWNVRFPSKLYCSPRLERKMRSRVSTKKAAAFKGQRPDSSPIHKESLLRSK
jgi:hypothetical protein